MSAFKRTISGLANQYLFHNVELIVFVEGGTPYNKSQVYSGNYSEESNDILFWKNIFKVFKNTQKIKFKSVGSKSTIKEIAVDIINGNISTVMVAMDNEFDEILNSRIDDKNIFYTYGYSWENDVWNPHVIKEVIQELSATEIDPKDISKNFKDFLKKIKLAVYSDGYLFSKSQAFFKRPSGYLGCVNCIPVDLPHIKPEFIKKEMNTKNLKASTMYTYGRKKSIDTHKHCYGHFLADYCSQVIIHFLKNRLDLHPVNKEFIYRMSINKFFTIHFIGSSIHLYYNNQFNR